MAQAALRGRPAFEGWPLVGWVAAAVALLCATGFALAGAGEEGVRLGLRITARTSFALFTAAFAASALHTLWPGSATRWLLRNRRQLGVSFAVSHTFHLGLILWLAALPDGFDPGQPDAVTLAFGGLAFVVLYAMAATSSDRAVAWLGPRRWKRLHTFGIHYVGLIFFLTALPAVPAHPVAALYVVGFVAALGVRLACARRRSRRAQPAPAG